MKGFAPALVAFVLALAPTAHAQRGTDSSLVPYRDERLPFARRVDDLVGRMTLAEKVSQMTDVAAPIDRLGIPAYNWWNEGLHGVARAGLATSFPQAIGIAATWDSSLVYRMATVISDEFRAKYHEYLRENQHGRYQGLTVWSPNINLFRDPRWGRGQETYGEDPFLTGHIAVPFIRGLQGDDRKYLKTIATVKHFAVHSGPELERHGFDAIVSERDLRESYLPQFEQGIKVGGAYSLMCAYNRIGGQAACASPRLEQDILRGEWKFPGYIVSDCGAIDDIFLRHKVAPTAAAASAAAVKTGTDLECGNAYPHLVDAVKHGLITEAQIDTSVRRLFLARMKLGMFDAPEHVRWANTPISVLDAPAHRQLARQVARESIVLLKNENATLPLAKTLGTIAVLGPNADQAAMLMGNYNGDPADPVTPLRGIREAVSPQTKVLYARGADLADGFPAVETTSPAVPTAPQRQLARFAADSALQIAQHADVVIMVLGLTARLEGEEMPVAIDGFRGGDRTRIDLPASQQRLLEQVSALGKPVVLVLLNGSALAVNWAQDHVPAIVEGWYPGQAGGTALADVLFGDYNPAGRLPVTFYRDTTDLPAFNNYNMAGRTYRYFKGTPLYPFGHGLSYTTFAYSALHTSAASIGANRTLTVSVNIANTGKRAGDEVVQLYTRHIGSAVARPNRELRGFKRISLKPGERRVVRFTLPATSLAYWNESSHAWTLEGDTVAVEVGASSGDIRLSKTVKVLPNR